MNQFRISVPAEFSFQFCLDFLKRSPKELLHKVEDDCAIKLAPINNRTILFKMAQATDNALEIKILNGRISKQEAAELKNFIIEWFDLDKDLKPFYELAERDKLLKPLVEKYYGYRIVGQPDLFESLIWAVLGQQINLQFAYTLKHRFVEKFGERINFKGNDYFLFPKSEIVATLSDDDLLPLQFSRQKSKYVVLIAQAFCSGMVSKNLLTGIPLVMAKEKLMEIKGVGNWTANYALMKTFRYSDAFPLEDAGVHNAIKNLKKMKTKPTLDQVKRIFKKYKDWEAYATLYLWKSL